MTSEAGVTSEPGGPLAEITCVAGEAFCISGPTGQIRRGGRHGLFVRDTRVLDVLEVHVDGQEPAALLGRRVSAHAARFAGAWTPPGYSHPDPPVLVDRRRVVSASLNEEIRLTNYSTEPVTLWLTATVATDFAYIFDVKHGRPPEHAAATPTSTSSSTRAWRTSRRCSWRTSNTPPTTTPLPAAPGF